MAIITSSSMIFQLFLLLGSQATDVNQVLDRYAAAHKPLPKVEMALTVQQNGGQIVKTELISLAGEEALFTVLGPHGSYRMSLTKAQGTREIDNPAKTYDDHPYFGVGLFKSRLADANRLFPHWITLPDLREVVKQGKWSLKGHEVVSGIGCDIVYMKYEEPQRGGIELNVSVDGVGNIIGYDEYTWGPMERVRRKWVVTSIKSRPDLTSDDLYLKIPVGYMPFSVDYTPGGLVIGDKFPLTGWSSGSAPINSGKPTLMAIVGEDCEPSRRALPWLKALAPKLPVVLISTAAQRSSIEGALIDTSGKNLAALDYQATPYLLLVKADGTIQKMWMGFDPAGQAGLEREILAAASQK